MDLVNQDGQSHLSVKRGTESKDLAFLRIIRELSDLAHLGAGWTPWVVTRRCIAKVISNGAPTRRSEQKAQVDNSPSRTFTWTPEYPLVTFFTLRITFDILAVLGRG